MYCGFDEVTTHTHTYANMNAKLNDFMPPPPQKKTKKKHQLIDNTSQTVKHM